MNLKIRPFFALTLCMAACDPSAREPSAATSSGVPFSAPGIPLIAPQVPAPVSLRPPSSNADPEQQSANAAQRFGPFDSAPATRTDEPERAYSTERYDHVSESGFRLVTEQPLATFSVDVDTASYSNTRRFLNQGRLPPPDAVRIEELINSFEYESPAAANAHPIALSTDLMESPFHAGYELLRVGLRAAAPRYARDRPRNLVFLIDVSGSMNSPDKLPLLQAALHLLALQLTDRDRVAIVTYAGSSAVVLPPTPGGQHGRILAAIDRLGAGGATNGSQGIERAYALAGEHFDPNGINRVLLATDGDFNLGIASNGGLVRLIERERARGVYLTVLGFGEGNLNDSMLEQLADHGDGSYAYVDSLRQARKLLVDQIGSTLHAVVKDTKLQIEWNPARVSRYRLIGYDDRRLADEDFNDDAKDAGEMGDGQGVTALFEIEPAGAHHTAQLDPLRYQTARALAPGGGNGELCTIKLRYKAPAHARSRRIVRAVNQRARSLAQADPDTRFAAAVAGFGMLLRHSTYAGELDYDAVLRLAGAALGDDRDGDRSEFVGLVARARDLESARRL